MATPSPAKLLENCLKDTFARPFLRRFRYLYFGLQHAPDVFVLSDTEDSDFKYCEPMQATGLVKLHNAEQHERVMAWLAQFGLPGDRPMVFYFGAWLSLLSKHPWDTPELVIERQANGVVSLSLGEQQHVLIARPVDVHFTLIKLQQTVTTYQAVFFDQSLPSHSHALDNSDNKHPMPLRLAIEPLVGAGVLTEPCPDVNLVLIPGIEAVMVKPLLKKVPDHHNGIRIWAGTGPRCLRYGGYFHSPDVSLCAARDNIYIFPFTKRTV